MGAVAGEPRAQRWRGCGSGEVAGANRLSNTTRERMNLGILNALIHIGTMGSLGRQAHAHGLTL
jgi:hypothetical protein